MLTNAEAALWRPELPGLSHGILPWYRYVVSELFGEEDERAPEEVADLEAAGVRRELKRAGKLGAEVYGVDPGEVDAEEYPQIPSDPLPNLKVGHAIRHQLAANVARYQADCVPIRLVAMKSHDALASLRPLRWDFVFIDGDHRAAAVREDIVGWGLHVLSGGWLSGHDYGHVQFPDVKPVVDELFGSRVEFPGTPGDGVWAVRMT